MTPFRKEFYKISILDTTRIFVESNTMMDIRCPSFFFAVGEGSTEGFGVGVFELRAGREAATEF